MIMITLYILINDSPFILYDFFVRKIYIEQSAKKINNCHNYITNYNSIITAACWLPTEIGN